MFLKRADPLQGQVGGGWTLEIETFLGPAKWRRAVIGECHLGPKQDEFECATVYSEPVLEVHPTLVLCFFTNRDKGENVCLFVSEYLCLILFHYVKCTGNRPL